MIQRLRTLALASLFLHVSAPAFEVTSGWEEIPERGRVSQLVVSTDFGDYSFVPPTGWRVDVQAREQAVTFSRDDLNAAFTISFSTNAVPAGAGLKKTIERRWPGATLADQSGSFAGDLRGESAEFTYPSAAGTTYRTRYATFSEKRSSVMLELTAPDPWAAGLHHSWTAILNSFRLKSPRLKVALSKTN